jgi:hypothetical protein
MPSGVPHEFLRKPLCCSDAERRTCSPPARRLISRQRDERVSVPPKLAANQPRAQPESISLNATPAPTLLASRVMTLAVQLGPVAGLLAVFAAVLPMRPVW